MTQPTLLWLRRDLRLSDNPALMAAIAAGGPVIPVAICDPEMEALGAAPKWRMGLSLEDFAQSLERLGSRLILRRGPALQVLRDLLKETGARSVHWNRLYDPDARRRDTAVKAELKADGLSVVSHAGHVLFEPWTVATGQGGFYKVYTPFWNTVRGRDVGAPLPPPAKIPAPDQWPASEALSDWRLADAMRRGAEVVSRHVHVGEGAANDRLAAFMDTRVAAYQTARDQLAQNGTSGLSENLTYGEISARTCWYAGQRAMVEGKPGAETFLKELVWRDFAHHLAFHTPHLTETNWRPGWDEFPWRGDNPDAEAWRRGMTGEPVIDAGQRQLYVTGVMHNRVRMLVASYLTKHLMTHWQIGQRWFAECLIDWDPASNAMGWQWAAGSGPDAAPYFRIFNPATQAEKFDPKSVYRRRWVAELDTTPEASALSYFEAVPKRWEMSPETPYPTPIVDLKAGRETALAAYKGHRERADAA